MLTDLINSAFREAFLLSIPGKQAAGITTTVLLVALIIGFLIGTLIYILYLFLHKKEKYKAAIALVEAIGAPFYFYGDNIGYIIDRYGDALQCGQRCAENNGIAATITLGISLMLFELLPAWIQSFADYNEKLLTQIIYFLC